MSTDDDDALRRLRDADPARGSRADPWQLRSSVDRAIADESGADEVSWEGRTVGRLGRGTAYLAAACVAALIVGVGGYTLGQSRAEDAQAAATSTGGDETGTDSAGRDTAGDEQDAEDAPVSEGAESFGWFGGMPGGAFEESLAMNGDMDMGMGGAPLRLVPGDTLSTERGGEAEVLVQRPADLDIDAELKEIAERMGISGPVTGEQDWRAIQQEGRSVSSYREPSGLGLSYDNMYLSPGCAEMAEQMASWSGPEPDPFGDLDPDQCLANPTDPVSTEDAGKMARQVAADLGLEPAGLEFTTHDQQMPEGWVSAKSTKKDGERLTLDVALRAEGVISAHVLIRREESLGLYPVISPVEAVERANGPLLGRLPITPDGASGGDWSTQTWTETTPMERGDPIPVPGRIATATSATLSTGQLVNGSGGVYTVPIYLITLDKGHKVPVVALAEEALSLQE